MRFNDRHDAGRQLAKVLLCYADEDPVILSLPRGGVPIGFEIAKALKAPLDLVLVRKLGAPLQPELAIGAVVDGEQPTIVLNPDLVKALQLPEEYIEREIFFYFLQAMIHSDVAEVGAEAQQPAFVLEHIGHRRALPKT